MNQRQQAEKLDEFDPLGGARTSFQLNPDEVYLDGNSLGPLPMQVKPAIDDLINTQWGDRLIRSWNESWIDLPQRTAAKIAPLVGAKPQDIICADSVSVNLFKLIAASLMQNPARTKVLSVTDMFPTDLYISQGMQNLLGEDRCELVLCGIEDLGENLDENVNLVVLSQVNFRTGEAYDLQQVTRLTHATGARILWDLSHSVGVLPIGLEHNAIDFAVGCGYKFLNGGPGAPAFVYVRPDLQESIQQPLAGWMGHKAPFEFTNDYQPAGGMDRFLAGTPNILSLASLHAALDAYSDVNPADLFTKAQALTDFFIKLLETSSLAEIFEVIAPPQRGAQVSLIHDDAFAITQALIDRGIICDFRNPNIARFGFAPLYTRFVDVFHTVETLLSIIDSESYANPAYQQMSRVT